MSIDLLFADFDRLIQSSESVHRLRRFILDLAVRGKLAPQDPNDEPVATRYSGEPISDALPANWRLLNFGKFCDIQGGNQPPKSQFINEPRDGYVQLLQIRDFGERPVPTYIPISSTNRFCKEGEILIGRYGASIGKIFWAKNGAYNVAIVRFIWPEEAFTPTFAFMVLKSKYLQDPLAKATRSAQAGFNKRDLATINFPLPPLAEQHRIVAKVDELMALCDRLEAARAEREATRDRLATASLDCLNTPDPDPTTFQHDVAFALNNLTPLTTRPDQIKALRQTILNLAARGKLVPQDPNDEPASELLKRISAEKARLVKAGEIKKVKPQLLILPDVPFNPPVGWTWSTVGEICSKTGSGSTPRGGKNTYREKGIVFLRSQNIYDDGLRLHDVAYIDETTHAKMLGTVVRPADLLLNITGGSIGRCCRVPDDFDEANVSQHVAIIRIAINGLQDFVHALILSPYFQSFIFEEQTGAGRGGLPKNKMDRIPIALPPLPEQHRIVDKVDELMALCDRLEASLTMGDDTLGRLIGALLHEALEPLENGEAAA